jgi:hypothetical protein
VDFFSLVDSAFFNAWAGLKPAPTLKKHVHKETARPCPSGYSRPNHTFPQVEGLPDDFESHTMIINE